MKEKKKSVSRVIVRAALILLLLTLISGCFLGSTFARYVSKGDGSFTAGIAKWDINTVTSGSGTAVVEIAEFSPKHEIFHSTATPRKNTVEIELASIQNSGDVDAYISFSIGDTVTLTGSSTTIDLGNLGGYTALGDISNDFAPTVDEINQIFTISGITYTIGEPSGSPATEGSDDFAGMYLLEESSTLTISGTVTWTTDIPNEVPAQAEGWPNGIVDTDLRDTWIGENVTSLGWNFSWYAVQAETLPAPTSP